MTAPQAAGGIREAAGGIRALIHGAHGECRVELCYLDKP